MALKYSVLALGTRADAGEWERGCSKVLGQDKAVVLRKAKPTLDELATVFNTEAHWVYFGGHSTPGEKASWMFNDAFKHDAPSTSPEGSVLLQMFPTNLQVIRYQPDKGKVIPVGREFKKGGTGFALRKNLKVTLWAGCSLLQDEKAVSNLRSLFGAHLMLGFFKPTIAEVTYKVLQRDPLVADERTYFFERAQPDPADPEFVMDAWFQGALNAHGDPKKVNDYGFAAVDVKGRRWAMNAKGRVQNY